MFCNIMTFVCVCVSDIYISRGSVQIKVAVDGNGWEISSVLQLAAKKGIWKKTALDGKMWRCLIKIGCYTVILYLEKGKKATHFHRHKDSAHMM